MGLLKTLPIKSKKKHFAKIFSFLDKYKNFFLVKYRNFFFFELGNLLSGPGSSTSYYSFCQEGCIFKLYFQSFDLFFVKTFKSFCRKIKQFFFFAEI